MLLMDMTVRCVKCGEAIPEADLQELIMAEEQNRESRGLIRMELYCLVCYHETMLERLWGPSWDDKGDEYDLGA